jgi:hypothetical protein
MNDDEDVPPLEHHPMPESNPSPMYNSDNSMTSGKRYRRDRFLESHEQDAQSHHSIEGYFGYNDRGQTALRSSFGTVFRLYSKSDNCSWNTVLA